jgi:predicted O-methyltransferase YrrM
LLCKKRWQTHRFSFGKLRFFMLIPIASNGFWQPRDAPTPSLRETARLFNQINGQTIIEIGSGIHGRLAGDSVLTWAKKTRAKRIIAVDLDEKQIRQVKDATSKYSNVEAIVAEGVRYLADFSSTIDLIYLDFWTPDPEGALPGTGRAEAYRNAFAAARDKLNRTSLILIDDTDHIHPWKHSLIIPDARKEGFVVRFVGRQTLLTRNLD